MPLNGRANPVPKPSWLKEATTAQTSATPAEKPAARPWARKTPEAKKEESPANDEKRDSPAKITLKTVKKESESPKKEVTTKLQSREVKVPLKVEKTIPAQSILRKPEVKIKQDLVEEKKTLQLRDSKTPSKSPSKTPTTASSKSTTPSITPSTTPSKSPSKTPDFDSDDDDESSYESDTDSSEEETDSSEEDSNDEKPSYKPPSPGALRKHLIIPPLKKVSVSPETESPRQPSPEHTFKKPELRKVVTRQKSETKERSQSPEPKFIKPKLRKVPSSLKAPRMKEKLPVQQLDLKKTPAKAEADPSPRKMSEQFPLKPILRAESKMKIPLPPPPPPPPPPPGLKPPPGFEKEPLTEKKKEIIEKLKTRPRRRPDWSEMMKEVEEIRQGKKLKHVECNDRSTPIITCKSLAKVQGQYVFETEKKNTALDKLLNEIQSGVKLKPTKTNDRSRPVLDGLRKFRRQMTIEEQLMKSESKAVLNEDPSSPLLEDEVDELDDIDRVRDDLQSTKQMLALELRNKEAQERENKRLMSKIANLEAELERERQRAGSADAFSISSPASNGTDDAVVKSLKKEAEEAQKTSKLLEKKYQDAAEQLDIAQKEAEEQKRLIASLEKKLQGTGDMDSRRQSEAVQQKESSPEMELVLSEEEEDETEEQKAERAARRLKREVDMLQAKLTKLKDKETTAKSDRKSMRDAMKKNQQLLKAEKKKLKKLQKEVEKMAKMMQECEDEEESEEKEEAEEEEESEESEPESDESESEDSDSETESQSEAEDADDNIKKENLDPRVKRHDGRLSSLKKGNYLLEANVERLKDEIKECKEKCEALQADLDSVIDLC